MAFAIPRVIFANITKAFDWTTIPLVNDITVNSVTALLEYSIEAGEGTAEVFVRAEGTNGPGYRLAKFMSTDAGHTSIIEGQGLCPISEGSRSIQVKMVGDCAGRGLTLKITGTVNKCPEGGQYTTGFSPEMSTGQYINALTSILDYRVPEGTALTGLYSTFDANIIDRRFKTFYRTIYLPKDASLGSTEIMTAYENDYKQVLDYRVPDNAILVGMYSEQSSRFQDRIWKFRFRAIVASSESVIWGIETISEFANNLKEDMEFHAPEGEVITGIYSYYDETAKDRRYKIRTRAIAFINKN